MQRYRESAVERAMKVQEVLVRAIGGQLSWLQAGRSSACVRVKSAGCGSASKRMDRAGHFIHTPPAGQLRLATQVGRALQQLGIELIAAHSPQARGRKERLYGTLQGRWPQELRLAGITTVDGANAWLTTTGIPRFNARFQVTAGQEGTAFVPATAALDRVFAVQHERTVAADNTVSLGNKQLQLGASRLRCHFVRCRVVVHEHLDDTLSITYGPHVIGRIRRRRAAPGARGRRLTSKRRTRTDHVPLRADILTYYSHRGGSFPMQLDRW
jgi:hypothetical protein